MHIFLVLMKLQHQSMGRSSLFFSILFWHYFLCFKCKAEKPKVKMEQNGTMVTVEQRCPYCCTKPFRWRSQPFILGRYPAGNILLSFATLMSGASISNLLVFPHFGLAAYTSRTFFYHQCIFILPSILKYWENYQAKLVQSLKFFKDSVWSGDGLTPWATQLNMEHTQCHIVPYQLASPGQE